MQGSQDLLVKNLRKLLEEFDTSDEAAYLYRLKEMEKLCSKITDETLREILDKELENIIRFMRLKSTWMTFLNFRI